MVRIMITIKWVHRISRSVLVAFLFSVILMVSNFSCKGKIVKKNNDCQYSLYKTETLYLNYCGNCHLINLDANLYGLKNINELSKFDSIYIRMKILDSTHKEAIRSSLSECQIENCIKFISDYVRVHSEPMP
jgi:hypothetical protein